MHSQLSTCSACLMLLRMLGALYSRGLIDLRGSMLAVFASVFNALSVVVAAVTHMV